MKVKLLSEAGYEEALLGLSLSYNQPVENMPEVAEGLADKDGGHNKFLESMIVWLDITAPRYWWQQFDTYRVGISKQSESTMHTLKRRELTYEDFEHITLASLEAINWHIKNSDLELSKGVLPEGFLQRRVVCANYKALRYIIGQRYTHKLREWKVFCDLVMGQVKYPTFLLSEDERVVILEAILEKVKLLPWDV